MSREVDRRDHSINKITPARERELKALASSVSGQLSGAQRIRIKEFDSLTGNPVAVSSEHAPARLGDYVQRALDHLRGINRVLGLTSTQPVEFVPDPHYQRTSSGAVCVHFQQCHNGIPIFGATEAVRFASNGTLQETVGRSITVTQQPEVSPRLTIEEAVLKAAQHVATPDADEKYAKDQFGQPLQPSQVNLTDFEPTISATFPETPERKTVLEAGPFGDAIKARLLWFPLNDALRLSWEVFLTMPEYRGQYRTLVDAETGEILYCHQLIQFISARGNVFRVDGDGPREMLDFPRPLTDHGFPYPKTYQMNFPMTGLAKTARSATAPVLT
jgi:extracellular elastinolytic metalloproteinase